MSVFDDPLKNPSAMRLLNGGLKLLALLVVTVLPAFVTTLPPVTASRMTLEREAGRVSAVTQRYMFFVVPYRTERIDAVTGIDTDTQKGSVTRERRSGQTDKYRQADDQGYLLVSGADFTSEIPADAKTLEALRTEMREYLQNPQTEELSVYLLGNTTFSLVFGGGATALVLLVVVCFLYALVQGVLKLAGVGKGKSRTRA